MLTDVAPGKPCIMYTDDVFAAARAQLHAVWRRRSVFLLPAFPSDCFLQSSGSLWDELHTAGLCGHDCLWQMPLDEDGPQIYGHDDDFANVRLLRTPFPLWADTWGVQTSGSHSGCFATLFLQSSTDGVERRPPNLKM